MLNPKVEIEFTTHGTHNLFGNIWVGRKVITNKSIAEKCIRNNLAKYPGESDDTGEDDNVLSLDDALESLDDSEDTHWTKKGLPDLNALKELTGRAVTRKEVDEAAPDLHRDDDQDGDDAENADDQDEA